MKKLFTLILSLLIVSQVHATDWARALNKLVPNTKWSVGDTYESLQWLDQSTPKPSKADLQAADITAKAEQDAARTADTTEKTTLKAAIAAFKAGTATNAQVQKAIAYLLKQSIQ
jgi:hypothetical protein